MSDIVWQKKKLLADAANNYDIQLQIENIAHDFKIERPIIDTENKEYVLTVKIEELDT